MNAWIPSLIHAFNLKLTSIYIYIVLLFAFAVIYNYITAILAAF